MELLIQLGVVLALLIATYFIGSCAERRHFAELRSREARNRSIAVTSFETPEDWKVLDAAVVTGSVVISVDYFKRFVAGLRSLFGGRITTYEPLLDRGRREAMLRMIESARAAGFDAVVNVRLETSRIASSRQDGKGLAGIEMLAYGTALRRGR